MNRGGNKQGFTIVELMLAMGFVSALLLAIAMTVIQIGNIYNRGITFKNANQGGSSIAGELQRTIASTSPFTIDPGTGSQYIVKDQGGRLCTGKYSYIWNYGKAIALKDPNLNVYSDLNRTDQIYFVKVADAGGDYCTNPTSKIDSSAVDLLSGDQTNDPSGLAIQKFTISSESSAYDAATNQRLYNIEFWLGTNDQNAINFTPDDVMCKAPNESGSDISYCSIIRFNIVARAGNTPKEK